MSFFATDSWRPTWMRWQRAPVWLRELSTVISRARQISTSQYSQTMGMDLLSGWRRPFPVPSLVSRRFKASATSTTNTGPGPRAAERSCRSGTPGQQPPRFGATRPPCHFSRQLLSGLARHEGRLRAFQTQGPSRPWSVRARGTSFNSDLRRRWVSQFRLNPGLTTPGS